ncbi:TetR/AcrR family transcriptional regulator [Gordonia sp. ABSL1-1]|uniref:TetR/AcrR family transcriptional regulator n=1 Tax=Gordonia sp. ABSL1-1 TaxID=3053923 RepID=UPI002572CA8C|nr:TetR/AcrR family transcriptional regulator [Gordonia sp. ABSL1-1]MDL9937555.1 TetR/AcrR family transcriptional regulator [Gordonia sp. ABSL1-1]
MTTTSNRPYNGLDTDARIAQRRQRLLDTGLDILGNPLGDDELTLRTICGRAQLAQRYFYESFADKDVFAAAVYDWALTDLIDHIQRALSGASASDGPRIGIGALVGRVAADPRVGQLLFSPHQVNSVVVAKRFESTSTFVNLFSAVTSPTVGGDGKPPLAAHFVVGGVAQSIAAWLNGEVSVTTDELVDELVTMLARQRVG